MENFKVLLAYDEPHMLKAMSSGFKAKGCEVIRAPNEDIFIDLLNKDHFDVVIASIVRNPVKRNEAIKETKERNPDTIIILLGNIEDTESNYDTLSYGVEDYIFSPCGMPELWRRVIYCLEKVELKKKDLHSSELIRKFKEQISNISESMSTVIKDELVWLAEEMRLLKGGKYGGVDERAREHMNILLETVSWLIRQTDILSKGIIPEKTAE
ncbi:MAG: response regulator [Pseudomonadota bacterium]